MRTILFADVCKSTQIYEQHGDAEALRIVGGTVSVLSDVTTAHGGTVVKTIGDEVMSLFDDPSAACTAARAMHRAVRDEASLSARDVHVKVGLHCGEVLLEDDDAYGDAVNVAARMVGLAEGDQIITTRATIERLPDDLRVDTRSLGQIRVRGKSEPLPICEVFWQSDTAVRTTVAGPSYQEMLRQTSSTLRLEWNGEQLAMDAGDEAFTLGRSQDNSLVVEHPRVSRRHAEIAFVNGFFVLTDRSTNGTYVEVGDEEVVVHRDQLRLMNEGHIYLGQAFGTDGAEGIRFACEYRR